MKRICLAGLLFVIILAIHVSPLFADNSSEISLIGHPALTDSLTREQVKQIFLGRKTRWDDGTKIVFVLLHDKTIYKDFLKHYIGKTYSQYRNYWKKQVFTGKGRMPKTFGTVEELVNFLTATPGAISFARSQDIAPETIKFFTIKQ